MKIGGRKEQLLQHRLQPVHPFFGQRRSKLDGAIVNRTLAELKVEQHPDKTFVGYVERGFTFLGYQSKSTGPVGVAPPTVERLIERVTRLYERGASTRCIGEYARRWMVWVKSDLSGRVVCPDVDTIRLPVPLHQFPIN